MQNCEEAMQNYEAQQSDKGHKLQIPKPLLCRKPISCYYIKIRLALDQYLLCLPMKGIVLNIRICS